VLPEQKAQRGANWRLRPQGGDGCDASTTRCIAVATSELRWEPAPTVAKQTAGVTLVSGTWRGLLRPSGSAGDADAQRGPEPALRFGYNALGCRWRGILYR